MSITVRSASVLAALAVLLVAAGATQALPTLPTNGTLTTFQVGEDQPEFFSDGNSDYPIADFPIKLYQNPITDPDDELIVVGMLYEFVIPNFYDPLPLKTLVISMLGSDPAASEPELPSVLDIIGADAGYEEVPPRGPAEKWPFLSGSVCQGRLRSGSGQVGGGC